MIDEIGNIKDAIFFNQLESKCGAIVHAGDRRGTIDESSENGLESGQQKSGVQENGEPKFDIETVTIQLDKIGFYTQFLAVLVHNKEGNGLKNIDEIQVSIMQNYKELYKYTVPP